MLNKIKALFVSEQKKYNPMPLVSMQGLGQPNWTPRNYTNLTKEGYAANPIGYRCVRMLAEAASSVPLLTYSGTVEIFDHPVKALLAAPNPSQSGRMLIEALVTYLLVAGNAYLEMSTLEGIPRELVALRPDRTRVIAGNNGWPEAYDYSVNARSLRLPAEAVLHIRLFNPLDDYYGMSPLEAAQRSIDLHNAASAWNKAMLDNAARPSGALIFAASEGSLSQEQFDRIKSELETTYQGATNAGRPMLLEGGLDWKEMGFSPKDMEFIETRNAAAREIALTFGVPPMLLGIPGDNTFSNYAEANRNFWRQSVLPLLGRITEAMSQWLSSAYGESIRLSPDLDQVDALNQDRDSLWTRIEKASFLTPDEKREAVGYSPIKAQ